MLLNSSAMRTRNVNVTSIGRIGHIAQGIVYGLIGFLAANAALAARAATDAEASGALQTLRNQPFGQVLLAAVAAGLFALALYRFLQSAMNLDEHKRTTWGHLTRVGLAISAVGHAMLGALAARMALGSASGSSAQTQKQGSALLLSLPAGRLILGLVGLIVIGVGVKLIHDAYKGKFLKNMTRRTEAIRKLGQIGISARGVVFAIIGVFLTWAAIDYDPQKAVGLGGAFNKIAHQPHGQTLLLIVAFGFMAFGVFSVAKGLFMRPARSVELPHPTELPQRVKRVAGR